MQAAVGFSTHSGWAVAVTAGVGDDGHLAVVDRRRVTLISDDLPRMAYHAAAELDAGAQAPGGERRRRRDPPELWWALFGSGGRGIAVVAAANPGVLAAATPDHGRRASSTCGS